MARTRRMLTWIRPTITRRIRASPPPSRVRSHPKDIRSRRNRRRRKMNSWKKKLDWNSEKLYTTALVRNIKVPAEHWQCLPRMKKWRSQSTSGSEKWCVYYFAKRHLLTLRATMELNKACNILTIALMTWSSGSLIQSMAWCSILYCQLLENRGKILSGKMTCFKFRWFSENGSLF